jgi:hypothetical protein
MRTFRRSCGGRRGSLPGLEPVNRAGGVKIIDTLAVERCSPYSAGGPKPFNMLANLALTGCK